MTDTPPMPPSGENVPAEGEQPLPYEHADTLGTEPEPKRGRRGMVIGAGAAVLALVAGGAIVATTRLAGGGTQPDEVVPKSAFGYFKLDLDPAAGQKLAARSFLDRFPTLKGKTGSGEESPFESLLEEFIEDEDIDYTTDIKPWFGKRVGAAIFPGATTSTPNFVAAFQSKDDAKARASLEKVKTEGGDLAFTITKGYALVAPNQANLDAAVAATKQGSLRDNTTYRSDVDALSGDQVGVIWADILPLVKSSPGYDQIGNMVPANFVDRLKGRFAAGLHFTNDTAEVEGRVTGFDKSLATPNANAELLKNLPANTVAALSVTGAEKSATSSGFDLDALLGGFLGETGISFKDDLFPLLGTETVLALGAIPASIEDLRVGMVSRPSNGDQAAASMQRLEAALAQFGIPAEGSVEGGIARLALPGEYGAELTKGGLGASPRFVKAMGDLDGTAHAAYVDVEAILREFGDRATGDENTVSAVGWAAGFDGDVAFFRFRVVAK